MKALTLMRTAPRLFGLVITLVSALGLAAGGALAEGTPSHPEWMKALTAEGKPITVFTAKKFYTMDPGRPEASAIAVIDGKVLSTGQIPVAAL